MGIFQIYLQNERLDIEKCIAEGEKSLKDAKKILGIADIIDLLKTGKGLEKPVTELIYAQELLLNSLKYLKTAHYQLEDREKNGIRRDAKSKKNSEALMKNISKATDMIDEKIKKYYEENGIEPPDIAPFA